MRAPPPVRLPVWPLVEESTVRLQLSGPFGALPIALVAWKAKVASPGTVGVPLIFPVELFKVRPVGREPDVIDQVMGVSPDAASV